MEVAQELMMQSPLYLLSPEASIDETGRQIPSPNPTDFYAAPWSTWMGAVAPYSHARKLQKMTLAGSFTAVVTDLRNEVDVLRTELTTARTAAEEETKTLKADVATLTAARSAAEEEAKTLKDDIATPEEAKTLTDNLSATDMGRELAKRDRKIEKLKEQVQQLERRLTKVKNYVEKA